MYVIAFINRKGVGTVPKIKQKTVTNDKPWVVS